MCVPPYLILVLHDIPILGRFKIPHFTNTLYFKARFQRQNQELTKPGLGHSSILGHLSSIY